VRYALPEAVKHYEWKGTHGYRKIYKSRAEQVMKPINVESTMGHDLGVSESYWRPIEREVLEDYLKAVPLLTINGDDVALQKQVKELTEKTNNIDYLFREKLQEKDIELQILQKYEVNVLQRIIVENKGMK
jgi:hypothetical protein